LSNGSLTLALHTVFTRASMHCVQTMTVKKGDDQIDVYRFGQCCACAATSASKMCFDSTANTLPTTTTSLQLLQIFEYEKMSKFY